jgi:spermidine/putrescine-binding protein
MSSPITRRDFLAAGAGAGLLAALPVRAQSKTLVVATFPGTWSEAHRDLLAPYFKKRTGASVTQSIQLATDQIAKLVAAGGNRAPFDVAMLDDPQVLDAVKQGLIVEYPAAKSPSFKDLLPQYQDKWGPKISMQVIGIGYNPTKIKTPPKSWDVLWDPQYKGRVGLTALNSQLGIAFLAEPPKRRRRIELRAGVQSTAGNPSQRRRDRRQSRRLCDAMAAGANRHCALQFQLRANAEEQGRTRRTRDSQYRGGRLAH